MTATTRRIDYYYTTVSEEPGEAHKLLSTLADLGINLLAFTAVPMGTAETQLTVFPDDDASMENIARRSGITLDGPHPALLIQGVDELGALADIHHKLLRAEVHVFASTGIADRTGQFGYIVYLRPEEFERAARALEV